MYISELVIFRFIIVLPYIGLSFRFEGALTLHVFKDVELFSIITGTYHTVLFST